MSRQADLALEADRMERQERIANGEADIEEEFEEYLAEIMERDD